MLKPLLFALRVAEFIYAAVLICALVDCPDRPKPDWCFVIVPVLMLADYYLTIYYAWFAKRTFPRADLAAMELNPIFKSDVAKLRVVNFHHLTQVAFISIFFFVLSHASDDSPRAMFLGLFGFAIGCNGVVVVQHIQNIRYLWNVRRRVTEIRAYLDQLPQQDEEWRLRPVAPSPRIVVLIVAALLAIGSLALGPIFLFGGAIGLICLRAIIFVWTREARCSYRDASQLITPKYSLGRIHEPPVDRL